MLGQAVRRFTTSAIRASHYAEGPGQVPSSLSLSRALLQYTPLLHSRLALALALASEAWSYT